MLVLLLKSLFLVVFAIFVRSALPRYRIDQLLSLNWKILLYIYITFYILLLSILIFFL